MSQLVLDALIAISVGIGVGCAGLLISDAVRARRRMPRLKGCDLDRWAQTIGVERNRGRIFRESDRSFRRRIEAALLGVR